MNMLCEGRVVEGNLHFKNKRCFCFWRWLFHQLLKPDLLSLVAVMILEMSWTLNWAVYWETHVRKDLHWDNVFIGLVLLHGWPPCEQGEAISDYWGSPVSHCTLVCHWWWIWLGFVAWLLLLLPWWRGLMSPKGTAQVATLLAGQEIWFNVNYIFFQS